MFAGLEYFIYNNVLHSLSIWFIISLTHSQEHTNNKQCHLPRSTHWNANWRMPRKENLLRGQSISQKVGRQTTTQYDTTRNWKHWPKTATMVSQHTYRPNSKRWWMNWKRNANVLSVWMSLRPRIWKSPTVDTSITRNVSQKLLTTNVLLADANWNGILIDYINIHTLSNIQNGWTVH